MRFHFPSHSIPVLGSQPRKKTTRSFGFAAWIFALLSLVTGIVWAQIAWESYWSWDPKETLTLLLFAVV
jgi:ABC-type transport system involved in cytochrome c biogenesis permease subunit